MSIKKNSLTYLLSLINRLEDMIELVINARQASIALGMEVRRILPFRLRRMVGPFIFMDHAGLSNMSDSLCLPWMSSRVPI